METQSLLNEFFDYVRKAPTAFQAVSESAAMLRKAGYISLNEMKDWSLLPGKRYFVTRNESALIAFVLPDRMEQIHFQIVASHADSPCFKLKPKAEELTAGHYLRFNVERYGGMIMSTWLDRPLSIAGRIMVRTENGVESRLFDAEKELVLIPNLPIHFNREVNNGYTFNAQNDMLPLYGAGKEIGTLEQMLCDNGEILAHDLFLYNRERGCQWGANQEYFSAPRIDNLECVFLSLQAILSSKTRNHVNLCAIFDNEEVGSGTKQGADSSFLQDILERICIGLQVKNVHSAIASSFMVSADNAHAVHPNHPEQYDADNRVFMNEGVVIKHNANQKYTTDAVSDAVFSEICRKAGCKVQHFSNRSDIVGGSTLGNIANAHASMNTVDIGLAQLAMHSSYETAGVQDLEIMKNALEAFYQTDIRILSDGQIQLV